MEKEKTKLKNLEVSKVDFVDAGANPDADVVLAKRQESADQPDSFWKGLIGYIKKHLPADQNTGLDDIEKNGAQSFADKLSERSLEKTRDEMWSVCYALQGSLASILEDGDLDGAGKQAAMEKSVSEFAQAAGGFISRWSQGASAGIAKRQESVFVPKAEALKSMKRVLEQMIEKAEAGQEGWEPLSGTGNEGGKTEMAMEIDKSKMTPEDQATFEKMAKAYGWTENGAGAGQSGGPGAEGMEQQTVQDIGSGKGTVSQEAPACTEGLEKGLHPAVKAELEALRKARETYEENGLRDVAKKYEVIGKKTDELVPVLKSLKASGEIAYDYYLSVLDEMVAMQNASGMFSEIGKSGGHMPVGATKEDEAFAKARTKAAEIRKSRPELTEAEAIDMAIMESPELQEALM